MEKKHRDVGGHDGLGDRRYERYLGAFDWVQHCIETKHFLEAIAVLDSLMWDRLSSRLAYKNSGHVDDRLTLGQVCNQLVAPNQSNGSETETTFRDVELKIKAWVDKRNSAMHATAKVFRVAAYEGDFKKVLETHRETANEGVRLLQEFDVLDTEARKAVGKIPGSYPHAFFPEKRKQ